MRTTSAAASAIEVYAIKSAFGSASIWRRSCSRIWRYRCATTRAKATRLSSPTVAAVKYGAMSGISNVFARSMYRRATIATMTKLNAVKIIGVVIRAEPIFARPNTPNAPVAPATIPSSVVAFDSRLSEPLYVRSKLSLRIKEERCCLDARGLALVEPVRDAAKLVVGSLAFYLSNGTTFASASRVPEPVRKLIDDVPRAQPYDQRIHPPRFRANERGGKGGACSRYNEETEAPPGYPIRPFCSGHSEAYCSTSVGWPREDG